MISTGNEMTDFENRTGSLKISLTPSNEEFNSFLEVAICKANF